MEAKIILAYKNDREAEAVDKAVSPDNVKVPSGLSIKTARRGPKVFTLIKCETTLPTFLSTIDDLLCCASIAEKAFSVASEAEGHIG
jgi:hypothetical protein